VLRPLGGLAFAFAAIRGLFLLLPELPKVLGT
jgi:hypothetical protein